MKFRISKKAEENLEFIWFYTFKKKHHLNLSNDV